jgi:hypothetical protein
VYIEDNLSNLALVERILGRNAGVELIPAMQGSLGLELVRRQHPDLLVLDVRRFLEAVDTHLPVLVDDEP